ncbi:MAG: DUF4349 domain-containing protein [Chloroflexota bacterium]
MKKLMAGMLALTLLLGVSVSCSKAPARSSEDFVPPAPAPPGAAVPSRPAPAPVPAPTPGSSPVEMSTAATSTADVPDRLVVRTGNMQLVVEDVLAVIDRAMRLAESLGGYVVSSSSWREGDRLRGAITIRVPAGRFAEAMSALSDMAVEVTSQTTSAKDVTEEYVDLNARLQNLLATEQQLLLILQKAEKVEDILAVQREITRTREDIERTKGRIQYLERTSETSLIEVHLEQSKLGARFTVDRGSVKVGEAVRFMPQISGGFAPYSYEWDFGNGQTSTSSAPMHEYRSPGRYSVTLRVTDDRKNTYSETRKDYVTVLPGWSAGSTARSAWNGLAVFGRVAANLVIWLAVFSPVWIVAGGLVYWRRRRRKKA